MTTRPAPADRVPLVAFVRELRRAGLTLGPAAAPAFLRAVEAVGLGSGHDVYHAFRSLAVSSPYQIPVFDRVFMEFFGGAEGDMLAMVAPTRPRSWAIDALEEGGEGDGDTTEEATYLGASGTERLLDRDFADLDPPEVARVRALIAAMIWKPGVTVGRRRTPSKSGDRPDPRRTMRGAVGPQGDLLTIATTRRRERRRPLIFIADVSGSMERYSEMLLYFAHAARGRLGRLEAFVFSTRLTRITRQLGRRDPSDALSQVSGAVHDWSGGTRIGECLRDFNYDWSRRVTRGGPIAVVVSDGWDRGDPHLLADEMARLHRSVHRLVWLNPLAGRGGYSPETRGMRAALPHVDDFLAAGTLRDLAGLVSLLESVPERR